MKKERKKMKKKEKKKGIKNQGKIKRGKKSIKKEVLFQCRWDDVSLH